MQSDELRAPARSGVPAFSGQQRLWLVVGIIVAVLAVDQAIKFWVKTSFHLGEHLYFASWFRLVFIENNGMAFGMELGSKLLLTLFRIAVVCALVWYVLKIYRYRSAPTGYLVCLALITAGAAGNIFDCVFYGVLFDNPAPPAVATLMPEGGGYAPLFLGKVVDMFYFPLFSFTWPQWLPWVGGQEFLFFQPIFNFADAAISVGVIVLLVFYHKYILSPTQFQELSEGKKASE